MPDSAEVQLDRLREAVRKWKSRTLRLVEPDSFIADFEKWDQTRAEDYIRDYMRPVGEEEGDSLLRRERDMYRDLADERVAQIMGLRARITSLQASQPTSEQLRDLRGVESIRAERDRLRTAQNKWRRRVAELEGAILHLVDKATEAKRTVEESIWGVE